MRVQGAGPWPAPQSTPSRSPRRRAPPSSRRQSASPTRMPRPILGSDGVVTSRTQPTALKVAWLLPDLTPAPDAHPELCSRGTERAPPPNPRRSNELRASARPPPTRCRSGPAERRNGGSTRCSRSAAPRPSGWAPGSGDKRPFVHHARALRRREGRPPANAASSGPRCTAQPLASAALPPTGEPC